MNDSLNNTRRKIDQIDQQILLLLDKRADLCLEALMQKKKISMDIYDPNCENNKITNICTKNNSKLSNSAISEIFKTIIRECRNFQLRQEKEHEGKSY